LQTSSSALSFFFTNSVVNSRDPIGAPSNFTRAFSTLSTSAGNGSELALVGHQILLFNITIVASRLPLLTSPFPTHCRKNILILRWQKLALAEEAHDRKLLKSLGVCQREGIHFVPLAWESTGGATQTVHETIRKWTEMESARSGYPAYL